VRGRRRPVVGAARDLGVRVSVRTFRFPAIDRVVYGAGAVASVPDVVAELGARRVVIVTGSTLAFGTPLVRALEDALGDRHRATFARMRAHAPRADIDDAIAAVHETGADLLVGYGGSSVTDATKIVAVRAGTDALPQVHVPTTLSSGEWTPASGMTGDEPGVKTYVVDPRMAPFAIVLDPEVTLHTPRELWLSTGVKAVDHACEAMWGPRAHPFTDALATQAVRTLRAALPATAADPSALDARLDAQLAGWMSMAGVVNVRVHLSHTLGHQIGARWGVPHGVTSGITLPPVMRYVAAENPVGVARVAAAFDATDVAGGADAIGSLVTDLGLPTRLRDVGADRADFRAVAAATLAAGRATGYVPRGGVDVLVTLLDEMW
jgi:alcohol dehydrogenase